MANIVCKMLFFQFENVLRKLLIMSNYSLINTRQLHVFFNSTKN